MTGAWPQAAGQRGARAGSAAMIALAHVVLAALLLRHAGMPERDHDSTPAEYIAFAFIPASTPAPAVDTAGPMVPVVTPPVRRMLPAMKTAPVAAPVFIAPQAPAAQARSKPDAAPDAPPAITRIDMAALRASARRIDSERVPTAGEPEQEPLRSLDDSKLARAVRQAKRPDCQTKYSGGDKANVLLLIPLAIETITDKGCKW